MFERDTTSLWIFVNYGCQKSYNIGPSSGLYSSDSGQCYNNYDCKLQAKHNKQFFLIGRGQKIKGEIVNVVYYNKFITKDTKAKHANITTVCKDNLNWMYLQK